jgi:hypothetical protein
MSTHVQPKHNGALVKLVEAFESATPDDRIAFARVIGRTELFEAAGAPAI